MTIFKKIFPFIIILILLILVKNNLFAIYDSFGEQSAVSELKQKLKEEKKKNQFLKERLYYVKTDEFIEDEAKKIGLLAPGEYFVIAPTPPPAQNEKIEIENYPNWKKWRDLFF